MGIIKGENELSVTTLAFDLDGTLYNGDKAIEGAPEVLKKLKNKGYRLLYLTNNSSKNEIELKNKLVRLGYEAEEEEIFSSLTVTVDFVCREGYKNVYCLGTAGLKRELGKVCNVVEYSERENYEVEAVVLGLDVSIDYSRLAEALEMIDRNPVAKLIACNLDKNYPVGGGIRYPGCGAVVRAMEVACEREVDVVIGKPNTYMLSMVSGRFRLNPREIALIGDSYESDIRMAQDFGCSSFLISTDLKRSCTNVLTDIEELLLFF
ncbi:HAD-IIA family hydrolase [uncultured Sanguibacteroides sp.]|uniref:HAD-IIA family hydrolase n=1 Tax=uncultured Sanguibacteroides sp. TaxID=1635151 RepID=UPI0025E63E90|nr:HAD-IIA family hydrolase [uncultured Sanguibacteroides sp.]